MNPTKLFIGLLTPIAAAGAAWLCGAVAKYGIHLDPSGVNTLAAAGAAGAVGIAAKLIHDVETEHPAIGRDLAAAAAAANAAAASSSSSSSSNSSEGQGALSSGWPSSPAPAGGVPTIPGPDTALGAGQSSDIFRA
jgi:hypothetical protein